MKNNKELLEKISRIIEPPYFKELKNYGIDTEEEIVEVMNFIYGNGIICDNRRNRLGTILSPIGKILYHEYPSGIWVKNEYDIYGNCIYGYKSDGSWWKSEYDSKNREISGEYSDDISYLMDYTPLLNDYTEVFHLSSDWYWERTILDENDFIIYREDSFGDIEYFDPNV